jgi:SRSO17 transposase
MSLLDHPDAQILLADAVVTPEQVRGCQDRIAAFLQRYLPRFYRAEQRAHATLVIRGLVSGLERKTCEPIAVEAGVHRKPVQSFVGSGRWDDERGPLRVDAMTVRVRSKEERRIGPEERLIVMRTVEAKPQVHYALSDAGPDVPLAELVRVRFTRHRIEEAFEAGKGEAGLAHYEVRSWVGWHHHMTLSLLALWFLILERRRVGGENCGGDRVAGARDLRAAAASPGAESRADRGGRDAGVVAEGGGADLQVAQGDGDIPAAPSTTGYELINCTVV